MARTRQNRKDDFDEFYNNSTRIFTRLRTNDSRAEKFQREYILNICPGSRAGGTDKRTIEVFWGSRNFEIQSEGRNWKALNETGATLLFAREDSGYVIVSLYPAYTENRKPIETSITISLWLDPKKLKNNKFIKSLWNDFMAYMEYTSLDGNPSFWQKLRVPYLRTFKHLVVNDKWLPTRASKRRNKIADYVLTVGLSGFILYALIWLSGPTETETNKQLDRTIVKIEEVSQKIDKLATQEDYLRITMAMDTISIRLKEMVDAVKRNNQDSELYIINKNLNYISNQISEFSNDSTNNNSDIQ